MRFQCRCSADAVPMQCVYNTNAIRKDCRLRTMIPKLGRSAMYWEEYSNTFTLLKDTFAAATTPRPLTVSVAWKLQGHYCSDTPQPCSTPSDSVVMITSVSVIRRTSEATLAVSNCSGFSTPVISWYSSFSHRPTTNSNT